jgi:hypothetical protein
MRASFLFFVWFLGFASGAYVMAAVLTGNMASLWGAATWAVLAVACGWLACNGEVDES